MLRLRRPAADEIAARLQAGDEPFSYPEVGATRRLTFPPPAELAARYDVDRHSFLLGTGRDLFERARRALAGWRHFEIPWIELLGAETPAKEGQRVAGSPQCEISIDSPRRSWPASWSHLLRCKHSGPTTRPRDMAMDLVYGAKPPAVWWVTGVAFQA